MKTIVCLVLAHLLGIAALVGLGFLLNDHIKGLGDKFPGVSTVLSTAFGIYCFVVNLLYHKNQKVYLWINRLGLLIRRTHTYWLPTFDFILPASHEGDLTGLMAKTIEAMRQLPHQTFKQVSSTQASTTIVIDELLCFVLRVDEAHLHVTLDRKILVPSHLYDGYRQRLAVIAETIQRTVNAESVRLGISITFGDGVTNPYYGFFVRSVPAQLLRHFEATFLVGQTSTCRIEAGMDTINIEGGNLIEVFDALSQVLALKAMPAGGPSA